MDERPACLPPYDEIYSAVSTGPSPTPYWSPVHPQWWANKAREQERAGREMSESGEPFTYDMIRDAVAKLDEPVLPRHAIVMNGEPLHA